MKIPPEQRPEYKIENAVINDYQVLGYRSIHPPIRRIILNRYAGLVDLILLPKNHKHKIVLIEAKHFSNDEAGEKVVGQLLKYYSFATFLGQSGIEQLRKFAEEHEDIAFDIKKKFPQQLWKVKRDEAFPKMEQGERIKPDEIGLFIAVDGDPERSLMQIVATLKETHKLNIGILRVKNNKIELLNT